MENLGHHLMQQKSRKSKDGVVTFISGGKTIKYFKIPNVRVESDATSKKKKDKRTNQVKKFRSMISGSEEATNEQYRHEISGLQGELKDILRTPFRMPHGNIMSMKAHLGLSGTRTRVLKRWLAKYQIQCESEASIHRQESRVINDNLLKEYLPLLVKDEKTEEMLLTNVPLVVVKNLAEKVREMLDQLDSLDLLTWHNGLIPDNQIWLKLGGDKGGGTFK
ncbi:uncharacterized protein LOC117111118 [Anneissia japonica]|uniref:uncharacterized protein LOC117111118 n=1 Tax=Anneissia japonica TaxID=1529436 RepID=UPI001425B127|nr:uncharacterized protein LOC117111118 [Anneissia japonica]